MKAALKRYGMIITYLFYSVLSTVLDTAIVWLLLNHWQMDIVWANTCGVVAGFVLGFLLHVKRTFRLDYTAAVFVVYFGTFLLGLGLANFLISTTYAAVSGSFSPALAFLISKGVSIVVPFFVMYYIRKFAYNAIGKKDQHE